MKKKKKLENGSETIKRIGIDFIAEIDGIRKFLKDERKIKISWPQLTDKLIKHNNWQAIKEDLKTFDWAKNDK
jgi:hypothetical protein